MGVMVDSLFGYENPRVGPSTTSSPTAPMGKRFLWSSGLTISRFPTNGRPMLLKWCGPRASRKAMPSGHTSCGPYARTTFTFPCHILYVSSSSPRVRKHTTLRDGRSDGSTFLDSSGVM